MRSSRLLLILSLLIMALVAACAQTTEEASVPETEVDAAAHESASQSAAAGSCADQPYVTTPGAAQDAFTSPTNFLRCDAGTYALCYYSGADPLPCDISTDDTGQCQCQLFTATADAPMYVEIGGILNQCVYEETVAQCGDDGSGCQNLCQDKPGTPGCSAPPADAPQAAACGYIADGTFNPSADYISTFSFATVSVPGGSGTFSISSNDENGQYAGCMTAPCTGSEPDSAGNEYTTCACPLWPTDGTLADYQFGRRCHPGSESTSPTNCQLAEGQIWSAAVDQTVTTPPEG